MAIVGLDFSINFPGVCIANDDFSKFRFQAAASSSYVSGKYELFIREMEKKYGGFSVNIIDTEKYRQTFKTNVTYSESERIKLNHFKHLAKFLMNNMDVCDVNAFAMEGIAYGAKGAALIDIAISTGIVRSAILDGLIGGDSDKMFIFSPSEMKNAICCKGNADKWDIFEQFLADPKLPGIKESGFYKFLLENKDHEYVRKAATEKAKHEIKSPWSDMIDAYLAVLKVYNALHGISYEKPKPPKKEKKIKQAKTQ